MSLNNEHLAFGSWDILSKNILKCLFSFVSLKIPTPGPHSAVNRADNLCSTVEHALLPLHPLHQRQQGVLHPEGKGGGRPCSESSHDSQGLPLHADSGNTNLGELIKRHLSAGSSQCGLLVSNCHVEGIHLPRDRPVCPGNISSTEDLRQVLLGQKSEGP